MSDNVCSICLETLLPITEGKEVGATVPCGHCFHLDCFECWKASKGTTRCKCPNCSTPVSKIIKLYIAPSSHPVDDDDDDDSSISLSSTDTSTSTSSTQDDDDDNDDEPNNHCEEEEDGKLPPNNNNNNSEDVPDVAAAAVDNAAAAVAINHDQNPLLVDLTMTTTTTTTTPPKKRRRHGRQRRSTSMDTTTNPPHDNDDDHDNDYHKKLTKRYKRYKRKFQQTQSLSRDYQQQHTAIRNQLATSQEALERIQIEQDQWEASRHTLQLQLDGTTLQKIRLEQDCSFHQQQKQTLEQNLRKVDQQYQQLLLHYKQDLEQARAGSLVEVKALLEEHPKLVYENQSLKEQLRNYYQQQSQSQSSRATTTTTTSTSTTIGSKKKTTSSKKQKHNLLDGLRQMDQAQIRCYRPSTTASRPTHNHSTTATSTATSTATTTTTHNSITRSGKYSGQSSRMLQEVKRRQLFKQQQQQQQRPSSLSLQHPSTNAIGLSSSSSSSLSSLSLRNLTNHKQHLKLLSDHNNVAASSKGPLARAAAAGAKRSSTNTKLSLSLLAKRKPFLK